jgi:hypothetical protein
MKEAPTEAALPILTPANVVANVVAVSAFEHAMRLAVAAIQQGNGAKATAAA